MNVVEVTQAITRLRDEFVEYCKKENLWFDSDTLEGACGICSYLVFITLKKMGYSPVFYMNDEHCFVTCEGYWIDLTLQQFAPCTDEVFFNDHPYRMECRGCLPHRKKYKATTLKDIRKLFIKIKWPDDQNPFKYRVQSFLKNDCLTPQLTLV